MTRTSHNTGKASISAIYKPYTFLCFSCLRVYIFEENTICWLISLFTSV
jgi:hypothetical protein